MVKRSMGPLDHNVLGILSTQPALVMGDPAPHDGHRAVYLALAGRVPVKVNMENGPIEPGDLLGPSSMTAAIALSVVYIPRTARIVRASVLVVREMEFVQAARAMGASHMRIIFKHVLPNCLAPLIVQLTFIFAYAVLTEAVLSYLGLGAAPPTPTWGNIIAEGRDYIRDAAWITLIPGMFLATTVLGLNLLGDGLRDVLDPRLKVMQG